MKAVKTICNSSLLKRFHNDQSGQVLAWFICGFLSLIVVAGFVMDGGQAYADHAVLQNSANSAALSAAGEAYDTSSTANAIATGKTYSGANGDTNQPTNMPGVGAVSTTITPVCLQSLLPTGSTCAEQTTGFVNAVHAYQSNTINTFFMRFFGMPQMTIKAEATATMNGTAESWNVAIIVDGTQSMSSSDTNCGKSGSNFSEFECALAGVQQLLGDINPCPGFGTGCANGSTAGTPYFRVAIFTFPNISSSGYNPTDANTSGCYSYSGKNEPYTFPGASATPGTANLTTSGLTPTSSTVTTNYDYPVVGSPAATYQITSFDYEYYSSSSTNGNLNTSDNLVKTIGYGANPANGTKGTSGCLPNVGGEGTYYAGALYAATEALLYQQSLHSGSKSALILLSDGDATPTSGDGKLDSGTTAGSKESTSTVYPYPSYFDQCQQAIQAGQIATNAGIQVITVAYGAETSGCGVSGTDSTILGSTSFPNATNTTLSLSTFLPCINMENISTPTTSSSGGTALGNFYADPNQSGSGLDTTCGSGTTNSAVTSIQGIFDDIGAGFTAPKLISNSAT